MNIHGRDRHAKREEKEQKSKESVQVGKSPDAVEETSDAAFAEMMGFDDSRDDGREQRDDQDDDLLDAVDDVADPATRDVLVTLVDDLQDERERRQELEQRVDDQQETISEQQRTIKDLICRTNEFQERVDGVEESEEKTRDIAKSAVAKAEQAVADPDQQEDAEQLPGGVEPSSSPLDFFANCRASKVRSMFVESNDHNKWRAIAVARRWDEFAQVRNDGSGIFWDRDAIREALTAELGERPHRQTVSRVWDKLAELGSGDIRQKRRRISTKQEPKEILCMTLETAKGLQEGRYLDLDLLEDADNKARTGGVTPVVTGGPTARA
jgi:hypothetical protein